MGMLITDKVFFLTFARSIGNEGGFQNDPKDRGNWTGGKVGSGELKGTKYGISAMAYPALDIKNLTMDQVQQIYYVQWWIPLKMAQMPNGLPYQLFDAAINHGMIPTNKMLQRAIGVKDDGEIGPITIKTVGSLDHNDTLFGFLSERLTFMTNISTWDVYGRGWARRIAVNLKYAAQDN